MAREAQSAVRATKGPLGTQFPSPPQHLSCLVVASGATSGGTVEARLWLALPVGE